MLARGETRRARWQCRTALGANGLRSSASWWVNPSCCRSLARFPGSVRLGPPPGDRRARILGPAPARRSSGFALSVLAFAAVVAVAVGLLSRAAPAMQMARRSGIDLKSRQSRGFGPFARAAGPRHVPVGRRYRLARCCRPARQEFRAAQPCALRAADRTRPDGTALAAGFRRYPDRPAITAFFSQLLIRVRALPGVRSAGAASSLPLSVNSESGNSISTGEPASTADIWRCQLVRRHPRLLRVAWHYVAPRAIAGGFGRESCFRPWSSSTPKPRAWCFPMPTRLASASECRRQRGVGSRGAPSPVSLATSGIAGWIRRRGPKFTSRTSSFSISPLACRHARWWHPQDRP